MGNILYLWTQSVNNGIMKYIHYSFLVVLALFCSCKKHSDISVIDVVGNLNNVKNVNLSDIATSIRYIPLETNNECIVGRIIKILYINELLLLLDENNTVFIFDNDGNLVTKISRGGNGPEEFTFATGFMDPMTGNSFYINTLDEIIEYDFKGNFIRRFNIPKTPGATARLIRVIEKNLFVTSLNDKEKCLYGISVFDDRGTIHYDYKYDYKENPIYTSPNGSYTVSFPAPSIYQCSDNSIKFCFPYDSEIQRYSYHENIVDTVYHISFGKYGQTPESSFTDPNARIISLPVIMESKNYLFMRLGLRAFSPFKSSAFALGIHYKNSGEMVIINDDALNIDQGTINDSGVEDDLKYGPRFWPMLLTVDGLAISFIDAPKFIASASDSNNPEVRAILNSIDENSNPIIAIVKLK